jgi:hypothetical protein
MYAIYRRQTSKGSLLWMVNFRRVGKDYRRGFPDIKHGGSAKAKKAAIAWRDAQLARAPVLTILDFAERPRSNNTSGVGGVHFLRPARQPEGIWQARLKVKGYKIRFKTFSVLKYGYSGALKLAVAGRKQLLAEARNSLYLRNSTAKRMAPKRFAQS